VTGYLQGGISFLVLLGRALTECWFHFGGALLGLVVAACTLRGTEAKARTVGVG